MALPVVVVFDRPGTLMTVNTFTHVCIVFQLVTPFPFPLVPYPLTADHLPHLVKILISVLGTKCFAYIFHFGSLIKRSQVVLASSALFSLKVSLF